MQFFNKCQNLDEVKNLYRELAKTFHPDLGGDLQMMQALNNEYSFVVAKLSAGENISNEEVNNNITEAEAYREAISKIIALEGLIIEVVGSWIWVGGQSYQHKTAIKDAGFMFAGAKKMWYFRTEENACKSKSKMSYDAIKTKYGSTQIQNKRAYAIA